jgi:hypothetical protein
MTHDATRRLNKNCGDSPVWRGSVPIASSAACIINTRHSLEAPLRVDSGVLASPAKRVPATQPHAVPRVDDASRSFLFGVARKELVEYLAERGTRVQLREDSQPAQPHTMDQQVTRGQVQLHGNSA